MSLFSINSEAYASEFMENTYLWKCFLGTICIMMSKVLIFNNATEKGLRSCVNFCANAHWKIIDVHL